MEGEGNMSSSLPNRVWHGMQVYIYKTQLSVCPSSSFLCGHIGAAPVGPCALAMQEESTHVLRRVACHGISGMRRYV